MRCVGGLMRCKPTKNGGIMTLSENGIMAISWYIHIYIIHFLLLNTPNLLDLDMVYGKYGNAKATDLLIRYVAKFVLRYSGRFIDPFFLWMKMSP